MIKKSGLNTNYNQFEAKLGVYYMTHKYFEALQDDESYQQLISFSSIVIDEYDWLMFEGSPQQMIQSISQLKQASLVIGLSGSTLSQKEETCLETAFEIKEVKFPSLSSLKSDRKIHIQDMLFAQSQQEYCKHLYEVCMKQTLLSPVIIVASSSYALTESYFRKFKELQFFSMKGLKGSKADAYLEEKFNIKNNNKRYGVFFITELQGRGTDFHSSREIEDNGGLYLIICDIFSKRSTQQIIGRVGRLENKGQWRHILWINGCQDTVEQAIQFRQEFLENETHIRFSKLQTILSQKYGLAGKLQSTQQNSPENENQSEQLEEPQREISAFEDEFDNEKTPLIEERNQQESNQKNAPSPKNANQIQCSMLKTQQSSGDIEEVKIIKQQPIIGSPISAKSQGSQKQSSNDEVEAHKVLTVKTQIPDSKRGNKEKEKNLNRDKRNAQELIKGSATKGKRIENNLPKKDQSSHSLKPTQQLTTNLLAKRVTRNSVKGL